MNEIEIWENEFLKKLKKIKKNFEKSFTFDLEFEEKKKILKNISEHFKKYFDVTEQEQHTGAYHVVFYFKLDIINFKKFKKNYLNIFNAYYKIGYGLGNSKIIDIDLNGDMRVLFQFQYE